MSKDRGRLESGFSLETTKILQVTEAQVANQTKVNTAASKEGLAAAYEGQVS